MVHLGRHDGDYARFGLDFMSIIDADAGSGNNLMGFQLRIVDVVENGLVWRNPHKVEAVSAAGLFGRQDMLELHALECG